MIKASEITAIVLAAGKSSRMGEQKLLLPWGKRSVLGQVIWTIRTAGVKDVLVIVGGYRELIETEAARWRALPVFNPDFEQGEMLSSVQTGIRFLPGTTQYCLIALGDNPQIETRVVKKMLTKIIGEPDETKPKILMPSFQMRRGHPWLIQRDWWSEILSIEPPETLRDFFRRANAEISYLEVDTPSIIRDLDTPEDYKQESPGSTMRLV